MLEKALIIVRKGFLEIPIPVMYNPNEYTFSKSATVSGEGANVKFSKVDIDDFKVTLFLDTYEKKSDVRIRTKLFEELVMPSIDLKINKKPPLCKFVWGTFIYTGIITKIDQKFTMFLSNGIPVRAELTVTFKSVLSDNQLAKAIGLSFSRKYWTVKLGDRLDLIAQETLRDPKLWRVIAKANDIEDIVSFPTEDMIGRILIIPDYYNMESTRV